MLESDSNGNGTCKTMLMYASLIQVLAQHPLFLCHSSWGRSRASYDPRGGPLLVIIARCLCSLSPRDGSMLLMSVRETLTPDVPRGGIVYFMLPKANPMHDSPLPLRF